LNEVGGTQYKKKKGLTKFEKINGPSIEFFGLAVTLAQPPFLPSPSLFVNKKR
jgi:hypothetical protein